MFCSNLQCFVFPCLLKRLLVDVEVVLILWWNSLGEISTRGYLQQQSLQSGLWVLLCHIFTFFFFFTSWPKVTYQVALWVLTLHQSLKVLFLTAGISKREVGQIQADNSDAILLRSPADPSYFPSNMDFKVQSRTACIPLSLSVISLELKLPFRPSCFKVVSSFGKTLEVACVSSCQTES